MAEAPTSTNEREAAQLTREAAGAVHGEPWLLVANVVPSGHGSFTTGQTRKLAVYATVVDTIHVCAGLLDGEGYEKAAERLRACLRPQEDPARVG